jgi:hypothetical protein
MPKLTCQQLRIKFQEIKTLKQEFDLELSKISRGTGTGQLREIKKEIEEKINEIEAVQTAHNEKEINDYTKKYAGPLFRGIFQKLPEKFEDIRISSESEKIMCLCFWYKLCLGYNRYAI